MHLYFPVCLLFYSELLSLHSYINMDYLLSLFLFPFPLLNILFSVYLACVIFLEVSFSHVFVLCVPSCLSPLNFPTLYLFSAFLRFFFSFKGDMFLPRCFLCISACVWLCSSFSFLFFVFGIDSCFWYSLSSIFCSLYVVIVHLIYL